MPEVGATTDAPPPPPPPPPPPLESTRTSALDAVDAEADAVERDQPDTFGGRTSALAAADAEADAAEAAEALEPRPADEPTTTSALAAADAEADVADAADAADAAERAAVDQPADAANDVADQPAGAVQGHMDDHPADAVRDHVGDHPADAVQDHVGDHPAEAVQDEDAQPIEDGGPPAAAQPPVDGAEPADPAPPADELVEAAEQPDDPTTRPRPATEPLPDAVTAGELPVDATEGELPVDVTDGALFEDITDEGLPGQATEDSTRGADGDLTDDAADADRWTPEYVPDQYADRVAGARYVESGERGAWNRELNNPAPDTAYVVDDSFCFVTDDKARCVYAEGRLTDGDAEGDRNVYQQGRAGRREFDAEAARHVTAEQPSRLADDQGGHLFASRFDGPGEAINLLPMDAGLNGAGRENWWAMENTIADYLEQNPDSHATLVIDPRYDGPSTRPDVLVAEYRLGDQPPVRLEFENGWG